MLLLSIFFYQNSHTVTCICMETMHVRSLREDAETCSLNSICSSIDFFHPGLSKCLGCEISNARRHASLTIIRRLGYVLVVPPSVTHLHEPSCEFNKRQTVRSTTLEKYIVQFGGYLRENCDVL